MIIFDFPFQSEAYIRATYPELNHEITKEETEDSFALLVRQSGLKHFGPRRERRSRYVESLQLVRPIGPNGVDMAIQLMAETEFDRLPITLSAFSYDQLAEFAQKTRLLDFEYLTNACISLTNDSRELVELTFDRTYLKQRNAYYDMSQFEADLSYRQKSRDALLKRKKHCEEHGIIFREANSDDKSLVNRIIQTHQEQILLKTLKDENFHYPNINLYLDHPSFHSYVMADPNGNILAWQVIFEDGNFASLNGLFAVYSNFLGPGEVCQYNVLKLLKDKGISFVFQGLDYLRLRDFKGKPMPISSQDCFSVTLTLNEVLHYRKSI